LTQASFRICQ